MAPHQDDSWDGDDFLFARVPTHRIAGSSAKAASEAASCIDEELQFADLTLAAADEEHSKPKSILRRRSNEADSANNTTTPTNMPSHWPFTSLLSSKKVHFPPNDVVTAIRTRPRTHILDIPTLYYSPQEVKKFKREYRSLSRAQNLARERMEQNSRAKINYMNIAKVATPHDNTYWRNKAGGRIGSTQSTQPIVRQEQQTPALHENDDDYDEIYAESRRSSDVRAPVTGGGIFSSVYDVAREAVSILNGPSRPYGASSSNHTVNRQCNTSLHLVDTLYLF